MNHTFHLIQYKVGDQEPRIRGLELNNIGQFNLLTGDNNTGKSRLLNLINHRPNSNWLQMDQRRPLDEMEFWAISQHMKVFIPDIIRMTLDSVTKDECYQISDGTYRYLSFEGNGPNAFFNILAMIVRNKGGIITVDNIASAVHFTRLVPVWKAVITMCQLYSVQIFASTVRLECIQAFVAAFRELNNPELTRAACNFTLNENPEKKIVSINYDLDQLEYALSVNFNVQG